jgi:D-alanine-D-alanine ligase-like ATP-grasp enzyme/acylphosphatase
MSEDSIAVKALELIAYSKPCEAGVVCRGDLGGGDSVNFYLGLSLVLQGRECQVASEGLIGYRKDKPMALRYWEYLEAVAHRIMNREITRQELIRGSCADTVRGWVEPTRALAESADSQDFQQWSRVQRTVVSTYQTLGRILQAAALQLQVEAEVNPGAPQKHQRSGNEENRTIREILFSRAGRALYLPEPSPPVFIYQGKAAQALAEAKDWGEARELYPNAFADTPMMVPLGTMDAKSHLMERECLRHGCNILRTGKGVFSADRKSIKFYFKLSRSPLVSVDAIALCTHKEATRAFLAPLGFPVPRGRIFATGNYENATRYANLIGYPVVVKPATGVRGIGVVANIQNDNELANAFQVLETSKLGHDDFIVEKHINGEDYRIMVIGGRVRAATLRAPASVLGDGHRTVADLILTKNQYRKNIPHLKSRPIVYTQSTQNQLDKVGYTLSSIPAKGERVILYGSCNLSQGGDSVNVLDEMHPTIIELAEEAVKAVPGLDYCGIDFLIEDHRKPAGQTDIGICELNAHAAIGTACYPMFGEPVNVPRQAIEQILLNHEMALDPKDEGSISVKVRVRGRVTGVRKWVARHAEIAGLRGYVKDVDQRTVEAVLQGHLVAISSITTACIRGPSEALPTSVRVTHVQEQPFESFNIIN